MVAGGADGGIGPGGLRHATAIVRDARRSMDFFDRVAAYGSESIIPVGGFLSRRGDRNGDFSVVLDSEVDLFDDGPGRERNVFTRRGPALVAGETNIPSGRESLVSSSGAA